MKISKSRAYRCSIFTIGRRRGKLPQNSVRKTVAKNITFQNIFGSFYGRLLCDGLHLIQKVVHAESRIILNNRAKAVAHTLQAFIYGGSTKSARPLTKKPRLDTFCVKSVLAIPYYTNSLSLLDILLAHGTKDRLSK
jgi:hypothetical protein